MSRTFKRELRNNRESIAEASAEAAAWLDAEEIPAPAALLARMAIDELLTNVVKYGYDDDGEHAIEIECIAREDEFEVRVVDDGREFDPLNATAYDLESPMEEREVGGLGLHLLREMSDRFTYERRDGRNYMALVKVHRV